jgi:5'-3' exonuclease
MGIPSYFKRLTDSYKGILRKGRPAAVDWLLFDFNCLIYHVLRRPDCPVWTADGAAGWQKAFLDEVARYALKVIRQVEPARGVYIAVDGVAPMAKIRQQRMRRFKAAAAAAAADADSNHWDKNAITPGTAFMDALGVRLQELAAKHMRPDFQICVSGADEPGEGEQKIMSFLRAGSAAGTESLVIYGLDADLIVLSLWTRAVHFPERAVYLFREHVERGEISRDAVGEELFDWFSIADLEMAIRDGLGAGAGAGATANIQDYCAAMMLLGNDFLPTSMSFRLKEEGHQRLLQLLQIGQGASATGQLWSATMGLDPAGWLAILRKLAADEEWRFRRAVVKKLSAKGDDTDPEDEPLRLRADEIFLQGQGQELRHDWRTVYNKLAFSSAAAAVADAARTYIQGMSWVVDYYIGRPVSMEWVYNWHFAPLWSAIVREFAATGWVAPPQPQVKQLRPVEQLGMVLPLASWHLIPRDDPVAHLPDAAPEWFPERFQSNSIGKRFAWECEPDIPIPTPQQMWARI